MGENTEQLNTWYRGRGRSPTKFSYTYEDIAGITGFSLQTIRAYAYRRMFNPKKLSSVVNFIIDRAKN